MKCFDILIVGHPRCGSGFIAYYLSLLGIKTCHEIDHSDLNYTNYQGLSSWAMTIIHEKNDGIKPAFGQDVNKIRYKNKIVYLRNPFDSFKSIINENDVDWSYSIRNKYILKKLNRNLNNYNNKLEKAIASYLFWYELLLKEGYFYFRIEYDLDKLSEYLKQHIKDELNDLSDAIINKQVNTKKQYYNFKRRFFIC